MKTAKLFQNGQSQAVRLPKDYRLPGSMVFIKRLGNGVLLIPMDDPWKNPIDSLDEFSEDFMSTRQQPPMEDRDMF